MDEEINQILIRMPNWLGDAVMATPVIADVRKKWPQATITAMCQGEGISSLLKNNPHVDEIFTFTYPKKWLRRSPQRDLITRLRQGKYDLAILLPNSLSSAWWVWRGGIKRRLGFSTDLRAPFLTDKVPLPATRGKEHLVITYKRLLEPLGISLSMTQPMLFVSAEEQEAAKTRLAKYQIPDDAILVGVNPGAAFGSAKCWLPERFAEVIKRLSKLPNVYILCFADRAGADLVHGICQQMPPNVIDLAAATNLRELIALIKSCTVFLTNDSGPMHIAAALNTPQVALFGSTNEIATGPFGPQNQNKVIHKHVACSPCYRRTCPIDFRCMKQIEADEVYKELLSYLSIE